MIFLQVARRLCEDFSAGTLDFGFLATRTEKKKKFVSSFKNYGPAFNNTIIIVALIFQDIFKRKTIPIFFGFSIITKIKPLDCPNIMLTIFIVLIFPVADHDIGKTHKFIFCLDMSN